MQTQEELDEILSLRLNPDNMKIGQLRHHDDFYEMHNWHRKKVTIVTFNSKLQINTKLTCLSTSATSSSAAASSVSSSSASASVSRSSTLTLSFTNNEQCNSLVFYLLPNQSIEYMKTVMHKLKQAQKRNSVCFKFCEKLFIFKNHVILKFKCRADAALVSKVEYAQIEV